MEFGWHEEEVRFRTEVRAFINEQVPHEWTCLTPGEDPYSDTTMGFCRKLAAKGWLVPHWPKEYGGSAASAWDFAILSEELWLAGEPRGSQYMNVNWIGPAIISAGTEEQKQLHLKRIAGGDVLWCQGFSEETAGSDLASMKTSAVRDGDEYIINGHKIWTSYAGKAEYCFLLTRTDGSESSKPGVTIFLVRMDTPGITVEVIPSMLDVHKVHRLTFDNVRVDASCRLGAEGEGWSVVRDALSDERVGTPRYARAEKMLEQVVAVAVEEGSFNEPGIRRQAVLALAACSSARLLTYKVRQARARGEGAGPEAYLGRCAIVRSERAVSDLAFEVLGEDGLESNSLSDGEFRTAMIAGLGGGSYEMQLNLIARLWLRMPK